MIFILKKMKKNKNDPLTARHLITQKRRMSVVVVVSNERDQTRAQKTICGVREVGQWKRDLVWIAIDFEPDIEFIRRWDIILVHRPILDMRWLWDLRQKYPMKETDKREVDKLIQYSKWRVFDPFFHRWSSLLYLDAGTHVFHPIGPLFRIPHKDKFIAPDDRFPFDNPNKTFRLQWDQSSIPHVVHDLNEYCRGIDETWLDKGGYFLNCMWLMDTALIRDTTLRELCALVRRFPISRTNEMAIMNLYFYKDWKPLPEFLGTHRIFDWTERHQRRTDEYILLKYPRFPKYD